MPGDARRGWHPLGMACTECAGPDPACETCNGSGIYHNSHEINDGLFDGTGCVGKVEAFSGDGPWYATAMSPDRRQHRGGAFKSHSTAVEWCERISGISSAGLPSIDHGGEHAR